MPKQILTQPFVDNVTVTDNRYKVDYFDTKQPGLLLKVLASGRKSYYLRYKSNRNKQIEKKIADARVLKLSDTRKLAADYLTQIAMGNDPFEQKKVLEETPTIKEFVTKSYLPYAKNHKRSWDTDESLLRNHILPAIGHLYMEQVTRKHIIDMVNHHRSTHKPGSTNRVIILTRTLFNRAIDWEVRGVTKNPTQKVELFEENNQKERYLMPDETKRLFQEQERSQNKQLKYIAMMLLLTGARKNEVLQAKWKDFDLEAQKWTVEFNKSGKTRYIPLGDAVIQLLNSLRRFKGCDYVFPNPKTLKPFTNIFQPWNTARKKAGLSDFRIHDLRHSFASLLISNGRTLYEVQKILGHTQSKTTQRYAHLSQEALVSAANAASSTLPLAAIMSLPIQDIPMVAAQP